MAEQTEPGSGHHASHGVENLINRLKQEGIEQGRETGDELVAEARRRADAILEEARGQAGEILAAARDEAASLKTAGRDALQLAARDAHLKLRETVNDRFSEEVRRVVGEIMKPEEFLGRLILQVAGRASTQAGITEQEEVTIKLPEDVIAIEDLRRNPEELREGTLSHVVASLMAGLLEKGISYEPSGDISGGIKAYLNNGEIEVDLTDEAVAAVLLEHLQPRFRALLEGVVR